MENAIMKTEETKINLTVEEWDGLKNSIWQRLTEMTESFVWIGFNLRKIRDYRLYELDGFHSVVDFAKATYNLSPSLTSRFISINERFSIEGNTDQLKPEYKGYGSTKLSEMLGLPDEDMDLIETKTTKESIRELKRLNKDAEMAKAATKVMAKAATKVMAKAATVAKKEKTANSGVAAATIMPPPVAPAQSKAQTQEDDSLTHLIRCFLQDNPDTAAALQESGELTQIAGGVESAIEILNPSGSRTYRQGLYMMFLYEDCIKIKDGLSGAKQQISYDDFLQAAYKILDTGEEEAQIPGQMHIEDFLTEGLAEETDLPEEVDLPPDPMEPAAEEAASPTRSSADTTLRVSVAKAQRIKEGALTYLFIDKEKQQAGWSCGEGEGIDLLVFAGGLFRGEIIRAVITCCDDCTTTEAVKDGYLIVGIQVI